MRKYAIHIATAAAVLTGMSAANAADLDYGVLRGASDDVYVAPIDWSGFYIGGHGGYTSGNARVGKDMSSYSATTLSGLQYVTTSRDFVPPSVNVHQTTYGGFAGYNLQLDDTVVGVEVDYTRGALRGQASDVANVFSSVNGAQGNVTRQSSATLTDYGTIRARAGYAVGSFLPFATAGLAVARLEETSTFGNIVAAGGGLLVAAPPARTSERYTFGFTVGAGVDFALTNNIVLRGEYQYALLDDFRRSGTNNKVEVNTFRGGAAIKF